VATGRKARASDTLTPVKTIMINARNNREGKADLVIAERAAVHKESKDWSTISPGRRSPRPKPSDIGWEMALSSWRVERSWKPIIAGEEL